MYSNSYSLVPEFQARLESLISLYRRSIRICHYNMPPTVYVHLERVYVVT